MSGICFSIYHLHTFPWTLWLICIGVILESGATCYAIDLRSGEICDFVGFDLHVPSGHQINGMSFDAEIHFSHLTKTNERKVVVAVLLQVSNDGSSHPFVDELIEKILSAGVGEHSQIWTYVLLLPLLLHTCVDPLDVTVFTHTMCTSFVSMINICICI